MKFEECVKNTSTSLELKRIAGAYLIDTKNYGKDEYASALIKAAHQYSMIENLQSAYHSLKLSGKRDERILTDIFLKEILLNKHNYSLEQRQLEDEIIAYEQNIINLSNELDEKSICENKKLFMHVLEAAWEHNDDMSSDEKNLLEKLRLKLNLSIKESQTLEAKIGRFPKKDNQLHLKNEIDAVRKTLQQKGILFSVRTAEGVDYDIIPDEIASNLKLMYGKEMREHGYRQMLLSKYLRNKSYLSSIIKKADLNYNEYAKLDELREFIINRIKPTNLLGGYSLKDGLDKDVFVNWCTDLKLAVSGTKSEMIQRIIDYYDEIKEIKTEDSDNREKYFNVFEQLAKRDAKYLRQQGLINKDLEIEHKFEEATNYIFEKLLRLKPLLMTGNEHPDGMLSYQNKLVMWDNKSKETPVRLKDHIMQFNRYIKNADKPVAIFMVIAYEFTEDSASECVNYSLSSETLMLLMKAEDLKNLAIDWQTAHKNDDSSFNIGYFKQNGLFNKSLVVMK